MRVIGIARSPTYSPGQHRENDRLILDLTAEALRAKGCQVDLITEADVGHVPIDADLVFSMCQGEAANRILAEVHNRGPLVINDPDAVLRCCRVRLRECLAKDPLLPAASVVDTAAPLPFADVVKAECAWVKRSGPHSTQAGDVVRVLSEDEYREALDNMHARDIRQAVVQGHVEGPVVKFYGVLGTGFFRYYRADDRRIQPLEMAGLRHPIEDLVRKVGLDVYGGDAVLSADGARVIDLNDWPSFAWFRSEAAEAIANHIHRRGLEHVARRAAPRRA